MTPQEKQIIKKLNKTGIDTRYISLYENNIYINNLKFSKLSRQKEEKIHKTNPDIKIIRSTLLQKICIKTSRTIKQQIKPRDKIQIKKTGNPENILLQIVLEPYRRKYGIQITTKKEEKEGGETKTATDKYQDHFVNKYLTQIIKGKKIEEKTPPNTIHPLINIQYEWIENWIKTTPIKYTKNTKKEDETILKMNKFLKKHIPQYKQSIKQATDYLEKNR